MESFGNPQLARSSLQLLLAWEGVGRVFSNQKTGQGRWGCGGPGWCNPRGPFPLSGPQCPHVSLQGGLHTADSPSVVALASRRRARRRCRAAGVGDTAGEGFAAGGASQGCD